MPLANVQGVPDSDQKSPHPQGAKPLRHHPKGAGYRWHEHDERFDAARHPNEPNRFGWVVEIDPFDPQSQAVKHTALGRFKHEGAWVTLGPDNRVVVYMGDDERNEYIYKFVSEGAYAPESRAPTCVCSNAAPSMWPGSTRMALARGCRWFRGNRASMPPRAFRVRQRSSLTRGRRPTSLVRPRWTGRSGLRSIRPRKEVYCTLTNNTDRGTDKGPAVDAANPRANNVYGHIIRWREQGNDPRATRFAWDVFVLCGDPSIPEDVKHGTIQGDIFGSPDGLWFDARGVLWIQTDISASVLNKGDYANIGNNQMLAADPLTKEIRRFLTGPKRL